MSNGIVIKIGGAGSGAGVDTYARDKIENIISEKGVAKWHCNFGRKRKVLIRATTKV